MSSKVIVVPFRQNMTGTMCISADFYMYFFTCVKYILHLHVQYGPRVLQHLHARKMHAIWRIYTQFTRGIRAHKILHALSYAHQLHANTACILLKDESFVIHTREVHVFLYGGNRVCTEKHSFDEIQYKSYPLFCVTCI